MRIFLAGGENSAAIDTLLDIKAPNVFLSYFYLKNSNATGKILEDYKRNGTVMALDSGAYTFLASTGQGRGNTVKGQPISDKPDEYIRGYIQWLKKYGSYFDFYVELDIDRVVGWEKVKEFREDFREQGLIDKLLLVWHDSIPDGIKQFEMDCQEVNYLAIGDHPDFGRFSMLLEIAKKYKKKVHAFATTKPDYIERFSFYSADSTSWKAGSKYGTTYYLQGEKILASNDKVIRKRIMSFDYFKLYDVDWDKVLRDDASEIDKINAIAWIEYGKIIDEKQKEKKEQWWELSIFDLSRETISEMPKKGKSFEDMKGKIHEIVKDPEIEAKRLAKLRSSMTNFKTGKYSKYLPYYCNNCYAKSKCPFYQEPKNGEYILCALSDEFKSWFSVKDFDIRDANLVDETKNRILDILMHRAGFNLWIELLDGGIQDKSLTSLMISILDRLLNRSPLFQQNIININKYDANELAEIRKILPKDVEGKMVEILRRKKNGT